MVTSGVGLVITLMTCAGLLWWWGRGANTPQLPDRFGKVELSPSGGDLFERLSAAGMVEHPQLFSLYQKVWHPLFEAEPGVHWVGHGLAPSRLLDVLGRSRRRLVTRVTLPEGWDSFQMADRLAAAGVCERDEFLRAVFVGPTADASEGEAPDSGWSSFEGRLYPASYEFRLNTAPGDVVARLVAEADKRHQSTFSIQADQLLRLTQTLRFTPADVIALASIVEKEAANEAELPLIASVFLNRLRDADFRPARMLQSDPTAAYGCKRDPSLTSCRQFAGKVTAAMLRDEANVFNTYRHPGLPPTPIGNPSTRAITAVLTAPRTPHLFFVSPDGGPHRFSRTLEEHEAHFR